MGKRDQDETLPVFVKIEIIYLQTRQGLKVY